MPSNSSPEYPYPGGSPGGEPPDPVAGQPGHFAWSRWIKKFVQNLNEDKLAKSGDTMTGDLLLPGDPSNALHATPKQYVDNRWISVNGRSLNEIVESGIYYFFNATNHAFSPTNTISSLVVERYSQDWGMQTQTVLSTGRQFRRFWRANAFTGWTELAQRNSTASWTANSFAFGINSNNYTPFTGLGWHTEDGPTFFTTSGGNPVLCYSGTYVLSYHLDFVATVGGDAYYLAGSDIFRTDNDNVALSLGVYIDAVGNTKPNRVGSWFNSPHGILALQNSYSGFPSGVTTANIGLTISRLGGRA